MAIITVPQGSDFPFGPNADVRLERVDANTLSLTGVPGTNKQCFVQGTIIDLSTALTLNTDSASDYLVSESSGSVSMSSAALNMLTTGYNDYSLLYLYVTDNNDCWNFSSPVTKDYRTSLLISDIAPVEHGGYMAASGDGRYARVVGMVCLDSSREMTNDLNVASVFNDLPVTVKLEGSSASWTPISGGVEITAENCSSYVVCQVGSMIICDALHRVRNDSANPGNIDPKIVFDATDKRIGTESMANTAGNKEYYLCQITHHEAVTADAIHHVKANLLATGATASLDYYPQRSEFVIARIHHG
jgi:hypothetical protein